MKNKKLLKKVNEGRKEQLRKALMEACLDSVLFDGYNVTFSETGDNSENAHLECTYQFNLRGASVGDCFRNLGGVVGEDFEFYDKKRDNVITLYVRDEDSACMSIDGVVCVDYETMSEAELGELGVSMAESCDYAIQSIINYSKSKLKKAA